MKRVNIIHSEWSNGWGGQEIRILGECLGMAARGHRVALCGTPQSELRLAAEKAGLVYHPLLMRGPWDLPAISRFKDLLKREHIDILNTHSSVDAWVGGMAARWAGVASLRTRHLSVKVKSHPLNFVYRLPQAVITTGQGIRRHLVDDYGLAPDWVVSIPTGVDMARFAPREPQPALMAELGLSPNRPVVAIVAILRSWKRQDLFMQMAALMLRTRPEVQFLMVGGGPQEENLKRLRSELGLEQALIMTGMRGDVEQILACCDACVLCSDQAEGVPQAVLQELACERAVVAADAGDVGQVVIPDTTGLLVPPGDIEALAGAVGRLLDDPELRGRLGRAGRELVAKRYSDQAMLDATEDIYAKVLAKAKRA
jgi:glycosyltransferase involved in cell wall biosynthesis